MNTTELAPGDHIKVHRHIYCHHGIYIGEDRVVHWDKNDGTARISCTNLSDFAGGKVVTLVERPYPGTEEIAVARAVSRLGEQGYSMLVNNCEHFATWCMTGNAKSKQVREATSAAAATLVLTVLTGGIGVLAGGALVRIGVGRRA